MNFNEPTEWYFSPLIFHLTGLGQNLPNVGTEFSKERPEEMNIKPVGLTPTIPI